MKSIANVFRMAIPHQILHASKLCRNDYTLIRIDHFLENRFHISTEKFFATFTARTHIQIHFSSHYQSIIVKIIWNEKKIQKFLPILRISKRVQKKNKREKKILYDTFHARQLRRQKWITAHTHTHFFHVKKKKKERKLFIKSCSYRCCRRRCLC